MQLAGKADRRRFSSQFSNQSKTKQKSFKFKFRPIEAGKIKFSKQKNTLNRNFKANFAKKMLVFSSALSGFSTKLEGEAYLALK